MRIRVAMTEVMIASFKWEAGRGLLGSSGRRGSEKLGKSTDSVLKWVGLKFNSHRKAKSAGCRVEVDEAAMGMSSCSW